MNCIFCQKEMVKFETWSSCAECNYHVPSNYSPYIFFIYLKLNNIKYDFYQLKSHKNFEISRGKDRKEIPYFSLENLSIDKVIEKLNRYIILM